MRKLRETLLAKSWTFLLLIFAAALLPFFILSLFNHPAPWDDYSVACLVKQYGYGQFYVYFLQHYNGRYISALLQGLNPLAYDSFDAFRFVPMVFIGGFVAACYYFMRRFWKYQLPLWQIAVITLGYCAIFFAYVRSAVELWYWYSSSVVYATAFIAVWTWLGVTAPLLQGETLTQKEMISAVMLALLLPGISEAVAISTLAFASAMGIVGWLLTDNSMQRQQKTRQWFVLVACMVLGLLLYSILDGTHARINLHTEAFNWHRVATGLLMQLPIIASWAANSTLWLFTLLCIPSFARLASRLPVTHFLRMPPWLMAILTVTVILAAILPYYLVTGFIYIFVRIENIAFFWFLFFWFANVACCVNYLQKRWQVQWEAIPTYAVAALLAAALFKLYSPNTKVGVAWITLLNGDAVQYEKDHQARYKQVLQHKKMHPTDTLLLPPIDTHMELLMFEELTTNPAHAVSNQGFAKYFGISAVKVQ
ncbi:MAG: hypothetical protein RMJ87_04500 [Cytophagales bacterium]|nr:hypothetical protein [Bernardetiaceae bacterium]MDW8204271.1 hypothetical protein [Cytophagales bacterium]